MITKFSNWQLITEKKSNSLSVEKQTKAKKEKKANRKKNKRSNRKEKFVSDSGGEYTLIKQRSQSGDKKHTFVLKGKGKDSPVWDDNGVIIKDVDSFLKNELESGENEGKYNIDSVKLEKYREGKSRDRVKFSVELDAQTKDKKASADDKSTSTKEENKSSAITITLPENEEGEKRIEVGDTSEELLKIKELIRDPLIKNGLKLGEGFGVDWLDKKELEEKDLEWIRIVRIGLGMKPANFISQGMVDKLIADTEEMKSANESIVYFNTFLKLNEAFDFEAANAESEKIKTEVEKKDKPKPSKTSSSGSTQKDGESSDESAVGESGLTDEQAIAYRTWANSTDKLKNKYGKTSTFDLDATGTNNSFVARSYAQAKADYESGEGNDNMLKKVWATTGKPNAWRAEFEKIIGVESEIADLGENEYRMGYISKTPGNNWAIHFASPRPAIGTIKAGDNVNFKNAWTDDEQAIFNVADVWKDDSGNLGAIYINTSDLDVPLAKEEGGTLPINRDYQDIGIIKLAGMAEGGSELRQQMQNDYALSKSISDKLVKFWTGSKRDSVFAPYKGWVNDDEDAALAGGYSPWLRTSGINDELAKMITPYYKKTMQGVIAKTKEEMTDTVANTVSWTLFDPSKVPDAEDEGLIALAKHEPLASTWVGSGWDALGNMFGKLLGSTPQMTKFSISGGYFDF